MKKLNNFVVYNGLLRSNGDEAQVGDSVRIFLDTVAHPEYPESIVAVIQNPISKVNCGEDRAYVLEYNEDDIGGGTLRTCDVLEGGVVLDCCALLDANTVHLNPQELTEDQIDTVLENLGLTTSKVYFDDFNRPDTDDNDIGPASSGQSYVVTGTGADSLRIVRHGLQWVEDREVTYIRPVLDFTPRSFGIRFALRTNPDAVASSYVIAMLLSANLDNLFPGMHLLVNANNISVAHVPTTSLGDQIPLFSRVFTTPLARDGGSSYVVHVEFFPEREEITLYCPDGHIETIDYPGLADIMSPHIYFESGEVDESVLLTRYEAAWASPQNEVRSDWSPMIYAEVAKARQNSTLLDVATGKIASGYMPVSTRRQLALDESWANTPVGGGSGFILNSGGLQVRSGNGGSASSISASTPSGTNPFIAVPGYSSRIIPWNVPMRIGFKLAISYASATSNVYVLFGRFYNNTTIGDLTQAGVGIRVDNLSLKIQTHDGTTPTTSSTISTLSIFTTYEVVIETDGSGGIEVFLNGTSVYTSSTAPTAAGPDVCIGMEIATQSGVTAEYSIALVTDVFTELIH